MIFLNLFLAILLENFEEGGDEEEQENEESASFVAGFFTSLKMRITAIFSKCLNSNKTNEKAFNESVLESPLASPGQLQPVSDIKKSMPTFHDEKLIKLGTHGLENTLHNVRDSLEGSMHNGMNKNVSDYQLVHLPDYTRNPLQEIYDDSTHHHLNSHSFKIGGLTLK